MSNLAGKEKIDSLLKWLKTQCNVYQGVRVENFTTSWKNGKALYVLMHSLLGNNILPIEELCDDPQRNFTRALQVATKAGVPELLEVDDLCNYPIDRLCMITYLHTIYKKLYLIKQTKKVSREEPIESENPFHKYYAEYNGVETSP
ncbi:smoothelin-like protein 1 [Clytia hemisphaerica]|uniref:smoothelin-like protein 1 n=1 Tax=Clytia hemisphaerica TaxID=252671 RepID=UPI0034D51A08